MKTSQTSFIPSSRDSRDQSKDSSINDKNVPLAARVRPQSLDDFAGQKHLVGSNGPIRNLIKSGKISSMIFWGPPGSGKTTLARIIANRVKAQFVQLSAVSAGKADVRKVIELARQTSKAYEGRKTILFLDEIHRFNKAQQDFLLPYVEDGTIILIGATTENPSFEVISALLSRCRVFVLERHKDDDLKLILERGIDDLKKKHALKDIDFEKKAVEVLVEGSNGDPRTLLNALEMAVNLAIPGVGKKSKSSQNIKISLKNIEDALQHKALLYDKAGEEHYNIISALHKSMRSSDENASLYWLARMLEAGEDPLYVARRMFRFAAEDVGNADPQATVLAAAVFEACEKIGMPECNVHLAQLALYLANAPKDNSAYVGYGRASKDAQETLNLPVPMHLRNAVTPLMEKVGYGKGYIYDHDVKGKKSGQQCLPDELVGKKYV
ncbi:replication-associated recombination protein A [Candidatus Dojkabacteria bacterium]|nr:replication-associated recombination protein A [Candidatus Dojkabacteria bacterium]